MTVYDSYVDICVKSFFFVLTVSINTQKDHMLSVRGVILFVGEKVYDVKPIDILTIE